MKKFFLGIMILTIIGCSDDSETRQVVKNLRESNENLQSELNTCHAKLDLSAPSQIEVVEQTPEVSEPEYEEVEYVEIDNTKCYSRSSPYEIPACGMSFWDCNDGANRHCTMNVKYKVKTEKKLIEE